MIGFLCDVPFEIRKKPTNANCPLPLCALMDKNHNLCLQWEWQFPRRREPVRGLAPRKMKNRTTGKPAPALQVARSCAEQGRIFRIVANVIFCVERCSLPPPPQSTTVSVGDNKFSPASLLLKIFLMCQLICHYRFFRSSGHQRKFCCSVCYEIRQDGVSKSEGEGESCVEIVYLWAKIRELQ